MNKKQLKIVLFITIIVSFMIGISVYIYANQEDPLEQKREEAKNYLFEASENLNKSLKNEETK